MPAGTIVSLTFDDTNADQLPAEQTMKSLGLTGTFFTVSGWIDQPGYLTQANLQQIAADGNEIGGHTVTHPDLVNLPADEATRQICNGRVALTNMGFKVTSFAYPFASQDPNTQAIVQNCGFNSARGLGDLQSNDPASAGFPAAETIPPANPYDTAAPSEADSTWTLADLQNSVTNAEAAGGGWMQLTFHHIAVGTDPTLTISPDLFGQHPCLRRRQPRPHWKLLPALDLGGCSPAGTPGHTYLLKAWYTSTAPTQFELYYRTGTGYWQYWTASPLLNAATDWTQATWTTPALPAGASGISWGMNIQTNGTITTDDYEMYDTATTPGP
ncbi:MULTISPECIES: polysaccharide deacetylase family protein [Arthrobacter]|uniref:polysaccharide deacetylase family protein n=1 Tax=Arthrobacter TaxID=1663 RepID=UPI001F19F60D|nr:MULTISPECIES: polysaccharide deacetylase family protein [Arthrobacter]